MIYLLFGGIVMISAGAAVTRWTLLYLFPSTPVLIFTQIFHSLTFGLTHYAFMRLIYEELESKDNTSLGMGLSTAILTFIGGFLYDISPGSAFLGMAVVVAPCMVLGGWMYWKYVVCLVTNRRIVDRSGFGFRAVFYWKIFV